MNFNTGKPEIGQSGLGMRNSGKEGVDGFAKSMIFRDVKLHFN